MSICYFIIATIHTKNGYSDLTKILSRGENFGYRYYSIHSESYLNAQEASKAIMIPDEEFGIRKIEIFINEASFSLSIEEIHSTSLKLCIYDLSPSCKKEGFIFPTPRTDILRYCKLFVNMLDDSDIISFEIKHDNTAQINNADSYITSLFICPLSNEQLNQAIAIFIISAYENQITLCTYDNRSLISTVKVKNIFLNTNNKIAQFACHLRYKNMKAAITIDQNGFHIKILDTQKSYNTYLEVIFKLFEHFLIEEMYLPHRGSSYVIS